MIKIFFIFIFVFISSLFGISLEYTNPKNTTKWLISARFGLFFDWSARVNFETNSSDTYDAFNAKGLQKGSLYALIKDKNGNPNSFGFRKWEMWNPVDFDPKDWMDLVNISGARYFIFTLNDRYGFLNLDSPATSIDSAATIWGVDIARALSIEASQRNIPYFWSFQQYGGIDFILGHWIYFKSRWSAGIKTYAQYRKKTLYHIITHVNRYGKCAGIYFLGNQGGIVPSEHPAREGEDPEIVDQAHSTYLKKLFEAQPWLTISKEFYLKKDPYYHPTLILHRFKFKNYDPRPNMVEGSNSVIFSLESDLDGWANVSKQESRTSFELIHLIALAAGYNENLVLRVTPNNKGAIPSYQQESLTELGNWLSKYKDSIFDTFSGPYIPGPWGTSTRKENKVFLHILQHSFDGVYQLQALPDGIKEIRLLNTNQLIKYTNANGKLILNIPPKISSSRKEPDIVLEVIYPKGVDTVKFDSLYENRYKESLAVNAKIMATQTSKLRNRNAPVKVLVKRFIDDKGKAASLLYPRTFWSAPENWENPPTYYPVKVEISFDSPKQIGAISILEKNSRIKDWRVEYLGIDNKWHIVYEGKDEHLAFFDWKLSKKVEAKKVRLVILNTYGNAPQLRYFRVF